MPAYALHDRVPILPAPGRFWIAPGAHVVGDVRLSEDVGVWFGATLRGDNEPVVLGAATNVQENAVLHTDMGFPLTAGARCTLGHGAIIHGCTLGDEVLVGMGATVMNGAVIGDRSLVGAGSLVTEGKRFEPGSLIVGRPAKAIRRLTAEEMDRLAWSATHYVEAWQRMAEGLRPLA